MGAGVSGRQWLYLVNGSWGGRSGCRATALISGSHQTAGRWTSAIDRAAIRDQDVWYVVGLRGTGSNTLVVKDALCWHSSYRTRQANDHTAGGLATNSAPVYKNAIGHNASHCSAPVSAWPTGARRVEHQGSGYAAFAEEKAKTTRLPRSVSPRRSDIDAAWRQLIGNVSDELRCGKEIPLRTAPCAPRPDARRRSAQSPRSTRLFRGVRYTPRCPMGSGQRTGSRRARRSGARRQPGRHACLQNPRVRVAARRHHGLALV